MNTQDDDEVQLSELTALTPDGNFALVQVLPLSELDHSGAAPPVRDGPLTTHSSPFAQEMAFSVDDLAGAATDFHVAPPSEVTTSFAPAFWSFRPKGLAPMATQSDDDEHDTERRTPVPPLTNCSDQVWPPSLLTRICAPTATQNVVVGQSTDPSASIGLEDDPAFHVLPPSVE
ncbi:MAG: hypothetical protein WA786_08050 [Acidimicrobiales bacterium]